MGSVSGGCVHACVCTDAASAPSNWRWLHFGGQGWLGGGIGSGQVDGVRRWMVGWGGQGWGGLVELGHRAPSLGLPSPTLFVGMPPPLPPREAPPRMLGQYASW
eukprot:scaffold14044_cov91-Isochrysis_galbana.AAC.1